MCFAYAAERSILHKQLFSFHTQNLQQLRSLIAELSHRCYVFLITSKDDISSFHAIFRSQHKAPKNMEATAGRQASLPALRLLSLGTQHSDLKSTLASSS